MPTSYTKSNFRQKWHINGQNPAKQAYKMWCKIFQALLSNHILRVGSFLLAAPYIHCESEKTGPLLFLR